MEKRQIGSSQLLASTIGLGCMSLEKSHKESEYILHKALDMGVNYFDTADLYDFGENERLLGNHLKGKRHDLIIATKVGNQWDEKNEGWTWNPTKPYIKQAVKASLKRLQTDYIDLYQLHGGTREDPIDESIEAFEELVQEGWIRYYGISSIRPNVIKEYVHKSKIISVMMQYSMLDLRPEEEIMPFLTENKISVIARGPVAKGLLTETFLTKLGDGGYLDYSKEELKEVLTKLQKIAHEHNYKLQELALQYCLGNNPTATVVPGARTIDQLLNNLFATTTAAISSKLRSKIKQIIKKSIYTSHR
ncbi:aldo/keto reductase [Anaerobacillus isosaccharinicus]|uniref:Aldo/keto reductase n=1 Tax=Anaerobacillus isosaccharinicus TaxID=1532552 RepID=A0A1S2LB73_9BACI|nr:aldo/keto reductase [Anaerobacillus isosaccharinicus]MBA5585727.1 aldo/keto reductase [Anaerobacillus isosaccharinicus]QOY35967.1 aldo/keto reductase [Anaerobacillus isosaccharinicus]